MDLSQMLADEAKARRRDRKPSLSSGPMLTSPLFSPTITPQPASPSFSAHTTATSSSSRRSGVAGKNQQPTPPIATTATTTPTTTKSTANVSVASPISTNVTTARASAGLESSRSADTNKNSGQEHPVPRLASGPKNPKTHTRGPPSNSAEQLEERDKKLKKAIRAGDTAIVTELLFSDTDDYALRDYEYDGIYKYVPAPYALLALHPTLWTPLQYACIYDKTGQVTYKLLQAGCVVDAPGRMKIYPIHLAAYFGRTDALRQLLKYKASVNVFDRYGKRPSDYARTPALKKILRDVEQEFEDEDDSWGVVSKFDEPAALRESTSSDGDAIHNQEKHRSVYQEIRESASRLNENISKSITKSRESNPSQRASQLIGEGDDDVSEEELRKHFASVAGVEGKGTSESVLGAKSAHHLTRPFQDPMSCLTPTSPFFAVHQVIRMFTSRTLPHEEDDDADDDAPTVVRTAEAHMRSMQASKLQASQCEYRNDMVAQANPVFSTLELGDAASPQHKRRSSSLSGSSRQASTSDASMTVNPAEVLDYSFIETDFLDIDFSDSLGHGAFGAVHKGFWRKTRPVAVKILRSSQHISLQISDPKLVSEIRTLSIIKHPCLIGFHGASFSDGNLWLVMEYASHGSLYHFLHTTSSGYALSSIAKWAVGIAEGMRYLHRRGFIHHDLKSPNVLLTLPDTSDTIDPWYAEPTKLVVKICDFGLSCKEGLKSQGMCGSVQWMAPECFQEKTEKASDVYSFAIILWELFLRIRPYDHMLPEQVLYQVGRNDLRPQLPDKFPAIARKIITMCWDRELQNRLTFDGVAMYLENWDITNLEPDEATAMPELYSSGTGYGSQVSDGDSSITVVEIGADDDTLSRGNAVNKNSSSNTSNNSSATGDVRVHTHKTRASRMRYDERSFEVFDRYTLRMSNGRFEEVDARVSKGGNKRTRAHTLGHVDQRHMGARYRVDPYGIDTCHLDLSPEPTDEVLPANSQLHDKSVDGEGKNDEATKEPHQSLDGDDGDDDNDDNDGDDDVEDGKTVIVEEKLTSEGFIAIDILPSGSRDNSAILIPDTDAGLSQTGDHAPLQRPPHVGEGRGSSAEVKPNQEGLHEDPADDGELTVMKHKREGECSSSTTEAQHSLIAPSPGFAGMDKNQASEQCHDDDDDDDYHHGVDGMLEQTLSSPVNDEGSAFVSASDNIHFLYRKQLEWFEDMHGDDREADSYDGGDDHDTDDDGEGEYLTEYTNGYDDREYGYGETFDDDSLFYDDADDDYAENYTRTVSYDNDDDDDDDDDYAENYTRTINDERDDC